MGQQDGFAGKKCLLNKPHSKSDPQNQWWEEEKQPQKLTSDPSHHTAQWTQAQTL